MYRLVFLTGPLQGRRLAVRKGDVTIGRDPDCHVLLYDPEVALRHAVLEQRQDGYYIRALSPVAPLRVNGVATREERLNHGDEIDVAHDRLLFQLVQVGTKLQKRRSSKFHGVTFVAVAAILLIQIMILAGLFIFWRMDPIHVPVTEDAQPVTDEGVREQWRAFIAQVDPGMTDTFVPEPFRVLPEWFVAPDPPFKTLFKSEDTFDEGGAPDVRTPEEE